MLLSSMKIDQIKIITHFCEPVVNHTLVRGQVRPMDPTFSRMSARASEAFVIFIVMLLTQFPTQHRYTDMAPDLLIAKIPYKAIPATGAHRGTAL